MHVLENRRPDDINNLVGPLTTARMFLSLLGRAVATAYRVARTSTIADCSFRRLAFPQTVAPELVSQVSK
jgi:hypothetical protein